MSSVAQARDRGQGQIQAHKQLSDPGYWHMFLLLLGLATSTFTAVETSDRSQACQCLHSTGGQLQGLGQKSAPARLQRPGLAAGADPWLCLEEGEVLKRWEALRWLASANMKTCGVRSSEIFMGFMEAVLAFSFLSGENCWGPLESRSPGTTVTPTVWLILEVPSLLPCPWPSLYISDLPTSGWDKTEVGLLSNPQKAGDTVTHPTITFSLRETLSSWGVPSWH